MTAATTSRLQLLTAAVLFSTGGAAIKACTLTSWQVGAFRSVVAAVALLAMLPEARARWSLRAVAVGAAYAATLVLFVTGNKLTTAANTIFLQSTAPLYIMLAGPWLLREPIRRSDILYMLTLALGLALFFVKIDAAVASAPAPALGNLVAAACGVAWALTVIGLRWMASAPAAAAASPGPALIAGNVLVCLVCLPAALPVTTSTPADWGLITYLGAVQIALAYVCMTRGIRHVPALEASLLLLLEPALNPLWAWAIHGERPGMWSLSGGALILTATAVKSWTGDLVEPGAPPPDSLHGAHCDMAMTRNDQASGGAN